MRTLVTGATGLIGRQLLRSIENPVVLSRQPSEARRRFGPVEAYLWAPEAGPAPSQALRGVEAVFNLATRKTSAATIVRSGFSSPVPGRVFGQGARMGSGFMSGKLPWKSRMSAQ
jgi:uncharacterized protein YbjT (DUF2867 family)